ncbi:MAG: exodeoxyribonuclease VII small subunit [Planctomycetota bacterium]|jgi:exodeoxyribonuclease VII small subunit
MAKTEGFEEHLQALERLVEELESGDLTLDDSLKRFQEGVERLLCCRELLARAEDQVKVLVRRAEGELAEEPFEDEGA